MRRTLAFLCVIAALGMLTRLSRREEGLAPTNVRPGITLIAAVRAAGDHTGDTSRTTVDLVFVARNCPVCRDWIHQLARAHAAPPAPRRAVFITDAVWPELSELTGPRVTIVAGDSTLAHTIGLRATPTLVAYDTRSGHVRLIAVGRPAVDRRFAPLPSVHF